MKKTLLTSLLHLTLVLGLFGHVLFAVPDVPNPKDSGDFYVSNPDGILTPSEVHYLDSLLTDLEHTTTNEFAVVVVNSIDDEVPKDYAHRLFNHWGIGKAGKDNGLLLLVVMDQRRIEVETGYGMEPVLPDVMVKNVQIVEMLPYFKDGNPNLGIRKGVEAYCRIMKEPDNMDIIASYSDMEASASYWESVFARFFMTLVPAFFFAFLAQITFMAKKFATENPKSSDGNVSKFPPLSLAQWKYFYLRVPLIFIGIFIFIDIDSFYMPIFCLYSYGTFIATASMLRKLKYAEAEADNHARCELLRAAVGNSLWRIILFPIPLLYFWITTKKRIAELRNHPRSCPQCNNPLVLLDEMEEDDYLDEGSQTEEEIKSIDYDVWKCMTCHHREILAYENISSKYTLCEGCLKNCSYLSEKKTEQPATYSNSGTGVKIHKCKNCTHARYDTFTIPKLTRSSSSSSSSSSSGSWGGGSSGGGGAGSSW